MTTQSGGTSQRILTEDQAIRLVDHVTEEVAKDPDLLNCPGEVWVDEFLSKPTRPASEQSEGDSQQ